MKIAKKGLVMNSAPYGSWKSPITSDLIVSGTIGLGQIALDGRDVYWIESRPTEKGRYVVVKCVPGDKAIDVTPSAFNVRTRVHEYGGGSFVVDQGTVYFSNFADQRLYQQDGQDKDARPRAITTDVDLRYADGVIDRRRNRMICVREDHTVAGREAINTLVSIDLDGKSDQEVLAGGYDFYSSPRLSPDGSRLAWIAWKHPNMPWDGTELWAAEINADGSLGHEALVAGGVSESIFQPEWSPDGVLYFVSDRTGWWNLYRWRKNKVEALYEMETEFGLPQWVFGMSTYAFNRENRIVCAYLENGVSRLTILDTEAKKLENIELAFTRIDGICGNSRNVFFIASSPSEPTSIVSYDPATRKFEILRRSSDLKIDPGYISIPEAVEFPTENGLMAHAFFYPPRNKDFSAPDGERPPLLVMSHGGPTAATSPALRLGVQYWTSRGIGVLDVNYGGSTGYGRAYRERLNGNWGVVDVDDCANGAKYLAARGLVDGNRLAITGGSAGGYTTLCALTFRNTFKAGASHYGVSDLIALDEDTHKFESRYTANLVGPYPQCRDLYIARSPIHHVERLNSPVIFFQGLEDKIVPPNQAEMMVDALRKKGLPVAYLSFEGEQHGFRQAANIKRTLDAELYFYSRVFGFEPADEVEHVQIENLSSET